MRSCLPVAVALLSTAASAQFVLQTSPTTASLRGINAVSDRVAWASGTAGTVVRTRDGGAYWTMCAVPPGAEKLDFRAVQAFDENTAIVMSSGKGDASRLYKTTDGCKTWKPMYTNPDTPAGFFDAILFTRPEEGWLLGDPVNGSFFLAHTEDDGVSWQRSISPELKVPQGTSIGAFAASNESITIANRGPMFGGGGGYLYSGTFPSCSLSVGYNEPDQCFAHMSFWQTQLPLGAANGSSGVFALGTETNVIVAVGGDYAAPETAARTAAFSRNSGHSWQGSTTQPHGYRSAVAYDEDRKAWIAVGTNGTDISTDDGDNWMPLKPDAAKGDASDADRNWNALSLPFVVGSKGRIGRLREDALPAPKR